jgi:hypothetical protein
MEHDSPTLLFRLGCEYLISARVIRPGLVTVVAHARAEAQRETFDRLAHEFTETRCAALDGLLITDPEIRMTRLRWLATGPVEAPPAAVKAEVVKLEFLRSLGADGLDLSALPAERRRFLGRPAVDRAGAGTPRSAAPVPDPADAAGAVGDRRARRGCAAVRPGDLRAGEQGRTQDARRAGRTGQSRRRPAGAAG